MADRPVEIRYKGQKFRVGELGARIAELPRLARKPALRHISDFMRKRFMLYPRYKYVSRRSAYPEVNGFFSDKQRKFVMAGIRNGTIQPGSPHRTQSLKNDWRVEEGNRIESIMLVNDNPAAVFAYSPQFQARQLEQVGWKNVDIMTEENLPDAMLDLEVYIYNNLPEFFDKAMSGAKG